MKLVNYKMGYSQLLKVNIEGSIYMTKEEFEEAKKAVIESAVGYQGRESGYNILTNVFRKDTRKQVKVRYGHSMYIRPLPTEVIAKAFSLPRFQKRNYRIVVIEDRYVRNKFDKLLGKKQGKAI